MFGSKSEGAAPAPTRTRGAKLSFLGSEVVITGNVGGTGDLHLDGRVDGDVTCGLLILGMGGQVNGNVTAEEAKIAGAVNGTVTAKSLIIEASARILGDLAYDSVSVESGAQVEGRVKRLTRTDDGSNPLKLIAAAE